MSYQISLFGEKLLIIYHISIFFKFHSFIYFMFFKICTTDTKFLRPHNEIFIWFAFLILLLALFVLKFIQV